MRGPHLARKTTEISLRTRIAAAPPPPRPTIPALDPSPTPLHVTASVRLLPTNSSLLLFFFRRAPPELFKVASTIWVILLGRISARARTHTHRQKTYPPTHEHHTYRFSGQAVEAGSEFNSVMESLPPGGVR